MSARLVHILSRKKTVGDDVGKSELARVLTVTDLTALGVGSTLGLGVYVLAGSVAKTVAGPAVCLSFLIAAIASAVAGLCYAEFAARVPKAGSAYVYSYVSVGEFVAYVIGWNLILEYVIGTASVARGLSNYIDALANNTMRDTLEAAMPIRIDFLSPYPDFFSFGIIMLLAVLLAVGVKESTSLNNIFTLLNLTTVAIVLVAGGMKAKAENWQIPKSQVPPNYGEGGFLPYGFSGVMAGAAKCFYGFVGFDCVATTGEEAKNPQRNIPVAIVLSLVIIFLAYFGISTVLTMMWPYYDQNADAPFPYVFEQVGWTAIKWIVTIGAIFALCTSLLGAMFPLPRILYAMACDGLLFKGLSKVNPKSQTPVIATMLSGLLAGIMATIFDLQQLIDMMSIGTLLAYTIVAVCVLILRYEQDEDYQYPITAEKNSVRPNNIPSLPVSAFRALGQLFNLNMNKYPTDFSSTITKICIVVFSILSVAFCALIIYEGEAISKSEPSYLTLVIILGVVMLLTILAIGRQPVSGKVLSFKVPWVPVIPCLSVVINLYLMLELDKYTWYRFSVWLLIGFIIYIFYGLKHSEERHQTKLIKKTDISRSSIRSNKVHPVDLNNDDSNNTTRF